MKSAELMVDRGGLVGSEEVTEYPLNGRNPFMLSMLVPGVDYNGELVYQRPFDNGAIARWNINGSNSNNEFLLDGAPNNAQAGGNNNLARLTADTNRPRFITREARDRQNQLSGYLTVSCALQTERSYLTRTCPTGTGDAFGTAIVKNTRLPLRDAGRLARTVKSMKSPGATTIGGRIIGIETHCSPADLHSGSPFRSGVANAAIQSGQ